MKLNEENSPHESAAPTVLSPVRSPEEAAGGNDTRTSPEPGEAEDSTVMNDTEHYYREQSDLEVDENDDDPGGGNNGAAVNGDDGHNDYENILPAGFLSSHHKSYDYLLKVLLVGDSDVGKQEILAGLEDGSAEYCSSTPAFKQTIILIDGKRVKLQLWDASGQGRFCTIIRSYSRGAQGILLVYDITNKWSFEGIERWVKEVDQHAPGIPKVLMGNRLHLAFKRQVDQTEAEEYAEKSGMGFFEVSPLVNFNISESFVELARMALRRNGMERLWRSNKVSSLYELCAYAIVNRTSVYGINRLPLPESLRQNLKSYALTKNRPIGGGDGTSISASANSGRSKYMSLKFTKRNRQHMQTPADAANHRKCGKSCSIS